MISYLNNSTLTVNRITPGYWDVEGRWIDGSPETPFTIQCNIQPYKKGKEQDILPEGIKSTDAYTVRTSTEIKTATQFTKETADRVDIDGRTYYAHAVMNWSKTILSLKHYKVVFIREDQTAGGSI